MRYFLLTFLLQTGTLCSAQSIDEFVRSLERRGPVSDFARLLSPEEARDLTDQIEMISKEVGMAYSVCLIDDLRGFSIRSLATAIGKNWQSGAASQNYGILFLIAQNDKQVFIATSGKIRAHLPDSIIQVVVDRDIIPRLEKGHYHEAVSSGINKLQYEMEQPGPSSVNEETTGYAVPLTIVFIVIVASIIIYDQYKLGSFDPKMRRHRWTNSRAGMLGQHRDGYSGSSGSFGDSSSGGGSLGGGGAGGSFGGESGSD